MLYEVITVGFTDPKTHEVTDFIPLPYKPYSMSISIDGNYAFASAEEEGIIYIVSINGKKA